MSDNEQKNKNRETVADILAKMERESIIHVSIPTTDLKRYADRIKAAWARESKAIATDHAVLPAVCITKPHGNAAAMREALVAVKKSIDGIGESSLDCDPTILMVALTQVCARLSVRIGRALSEPARNCDRFRTKDDARTYFDNIVCQRSNGSGSIECKGCPLDRIDNPHRADCREEWLFATAAERKGDGDEQK